MTRRRQRRLIFIVNYLSITLPKRLASKVSFDGFREPTGAVRRIRPVGRRTHTKKPTIGRRTVIDNQYFDYKVLHLLFCYIYKQAKNNNNYKFETSHSWKYI